MYEIIGCVIICVVLVSYINSRECREKRRIPVYN